MIAGTAVNTIKNELPISNRIDKIQTIFFFMHASAVLLNSYYFSWYFKLCTYNILSCTQIKKNYKFQIEYLCCLDDYDSVTWLVAIIISWPNQDRHTAYTYAKPCLKVISIIHMAECAMYILWIKLELCCAFSPNVIQQWLLSRGANRPTYMPASPTM